MAGGTAVTAALIGAGLFMFIWVIAMTQKLGPRDYGILGPCFFGFWALSALVTIGIPQAITTFVAQHYEKELEEAKKFIIDGNKFLIIIGLIFMSLAILSSLVLWLTGVISAFWFAIICIEAFGIMTAQLFLGLLSALNGFQRMDYVALGQMFMPLGMFVASLTLVTIVQNILGAETSWDIIAGALGICVGGIFAYLGSLFLFHKAKVMSIKELYNWKKSHGLFRKIISFGGPVTIGNLGYNILQNIPPVLIGFIALGIGWFGTNLSENKLQSGYFSTAFTYGASPMLVIGIAFAFIAAISEAQAQGKRELMQKYFDIVLKFAFFVTVTFLAIYTFAIGPIEQLASGAKFPAQIMGPLTLPIVLGFCFFAFCFIFMFMFWGLKRPAPPAIAISIAILLVTGFIFAFSYFFHSVLLAGVSMMVGGAFAFVYLLIYITKKIGLKIHLFTFGPTFAAAIVSWAIVYFLFPKKGLIAIVDILPYFIIFMIIYFFLGGYDTDDFETLRDSLKGMKLGFVLPLIEMIEKMTRKSPFFEWYKKKKASFK